MKNFKIITLLCPLLIFFLLELGVLYPALFFYFMIISVLLTLCLTALLIKAGNKQKEWLNYFIFPAIFVGSSATYIIFLSNRLLIHFILILTTVVLYLYFKNTYYFLIKPELYKEKAMENISSYGNFLVMFFGFSSIFAFELFLSVPTWFLTLASAPIIMLIAYQVISINCINLRSGFLYILISGLILAELVWAASFLPLNYNAVGLILAICYYILIGIIRFYFKGQSGEGKIKFYLIFGLISLLAILLSSKWL